MSTLSLRLPESLHRKIRELAERDDISINQFIAMAVAEKTSALLTVDYLEDRGRRGSAALFDRVLARVPDVPPMPGDELPTAKMSGCTRWPRYQELNAATGEPQALARQFGTTM